MPYALVDLVALVRRKVQTTVQASPTSRLSELSGRVGMAFGIDPAAGGVPFPRVEVNPLSGGVDRTLSYGENAVLVTVWSRTSPADAFELYRLFREAVHAQHLWEDGSGLSAGVAEETSEPIPVAQDSRGAFGAQGRWLFQGVG